MSKLRGPYKKYIYDEKRAIPARTLRHHKAKQRIINAGSSNKILEFHQHENAITSKAKEDEITNNHFENDDTHRLLVPVFIFNRFLILFLIIF